MLLRELAFVAATNKFEIVAQYINTKQNRIPDLLSRASLNDSYLQQFFQETGPEWIRINVPSYLFNMQHDW